MIQIDKALLDELFAKAEASDRKRMKAAIKREQCPSSLEHCRA